MLLDENQKKLFERLYDFVHDERHACANFIMLLDHIFPSPDGNGEIPGFVAFMTFYLNIRMECGEKAMNLIDRMEALIKENSNGPEGEEEGEKVRRQGRRRINENDLHIP